MLPSHSDTLVSAYTDAQQHYELFRMVSPQYKPIAVY